MIITDKNWIPRKCEGLFQSELLMDKRSNQYILLQYKEGIDNDGKSSPYAQLQYFKEKELETLLNSTAMDSKTFLTKYYHHYTFVQYIQEHTLHTILQTLEENPQKMRERFNQYIKIISNRYEKKGNVTTEEFHDIAQYALQKAKESYETEKGNYFLWCTHHITREVITAIKKSTRKNKDTYPLYLVKIRTTLSNHK